MSGKSIIEILFLTSFCFFFLSNNSSLYRASVGQRWRQSVCWRISRCKAVERKWPRVFQAVVYHSNSIQYPWQGRVWWISHKIFSCHNRVSLLLKWLRATLICVESKEALNPSESLIMYSKLKVRGQRLGFKRRTHPQLSLFWLKSGALKFKVT